MSYVDRVNQYKKHRFHPSVFNPEEFMVMQDREKFGVISVKDIVAMAETENYPEEITCPWCKKKFPFDKATPSSIYFALSDDIDQSSQTENIEFDEDKEYEWFALLICQTCRKLELMLEAKENETRNKESGESDD